ncbi:hypothetical protein, partial [Klebsiella pneumoniae]
AELGAGKQNTSSSAK